MALKTQIGEAINIRDLSVWSVKSNTVCHPGKQLSDRGNFALKIIQRLIEKDARFLNIS
jgi:hypothetical protein